MGTHANIAFPRRRNGWSFLAIALWFGVGALTSRAWGEPPVGNESPAANPFRDPANESKPQRTAKSTPRPPRQVAYATHPASASTEFVPPETEAGDWLEDPACRYDGCHYAGCHCESCNCDRLWVRPEFLVWWIQGFSVPALVTTSPTGTSRQTAGRLDQSTTSVLFGDDTLGTSARVGGRIRFGFWLVPSKTAGIDASYIGVSSEPTTYSDSNVNHPILARPFFNVEPGFTGPDSELVAYPGFLQGSIQVVSKSSFEAIEVLYRQRLLQGPGEITDLLIGYRLNRLTDQLSISDSKTSINGGGGIAVGTTLSEIDQFNVSNVFQGVELGMVHQQYCGRWTYELSTKIAVGSTNMETTINGQTTVTVPAPGAAPDTSVTNTGLLAQQTNIGVRTSDAFTVIPEVGVVMGCQLTGNLRATMGYTFMYWSSVTRSGSLIDPQLNLSQLAPGGLTGSARPAYVSNDSGVWAQGLSFGLDYRF